MPEPTDPPTKTPKTTMQLSFDLRIVCLVLLIVIGAMLVIWKPWTTAKLSDRTISVTGDATVTAAPDQYVFSPTYEFKNADKNAALMALTSQSDNIVTKLKSLGVPDSKIKTNADGNNYRYYYDETTKDSTYNLQFTITVADKTLSQKVQDYLVTTSPLGAVSPQASFSDTKEKSLQSQARDKATKDARTKADQSATNLGFKVTGVKSVTDGTGFSSMIEPLNTKANSLGIQSSVSSAPSLAIQSGENDLSYSVSVVYYIK